MNVACAMATAAMRKHLDRFDLTRVELAERRTPQAGEELARMDNDLPILLALNGPIGRRTKSVRRALGTDGAIRTF